MVLELLIGDYFVGAGALFYFAVAISELMGSRRTNLPKHTLGALMLLVIGCCCLALSEPGQDVLTVIRGFVSGQDMVSVQSLCLLTICSLVAYLGCTLNPGQSDLPVRIVCAIGATCALISALAMTRQTMNLASMSARGTFFVALAYIVNSFTLGCLMFGVSSFWDEETTRLSQKEAVVLLVVSLAQILAFIAVTCSLLLQVTEGATYFDSILIQSMVSVVWPVFVLIGIGVSGFAIVKFYRTNVGKQSEVVEKKARIRWLVVLLASSAVSGVLLQIIIVLSVYWSVAG